MRVPTCLHDPWSGVSNQGGKAFNFVVFHKSKRKLNPPDKFSQAAQSPFSFLSSLHQGDRVIVSCVSAVVSLFNFNSFLRPKNVDCSPVLERQMFVIAMSSTLDEYE